MVSVSRFYIVLVVFSYTTKTFELILNKLYMQRDSIYYKNKRNQLFFLRAKHSYVKRLLMKTDLLVNIKPVFLFFFFYSLIEKLSLLAIDS